jgi:plastocyanin
VRRTLWLIGLTGLLAAPAIVLPSEPEVETITVEIQGRAFTPNRVVLHTGHKTTLRFRNHDTELHAVVAKELFLGVSLNVGGNGAPEFGPNGLNRVIIPPDGLAEIQFTPTHAGTFPYRCDMPGHDMQAVIVVE